MPELRKDPVVGRWVIIATERGARPSDFSTPTEPPDRGFCPFCEGNEDKTPREIMALRDPGTDPDGPGWRVRVVPNKYPALQVEGALGKAPHGLFDTMNGIGAHEVIIDSPSHELSLADLGVEQVSKVLKAYQMRLEDLSRDKRFRYILLFKNHGEEAGASLEHSHTQLIATPIIPKRVMEELEGSLRHFENKERCIYCDIIDQEIYDGRRIIMESEHFLVISPFAARFPFEAWVIPRRHEPHFHRLDRVVREDMAEVLGTLLRKINIALDEPAYNFVIHTAPINDGREWYFHWHLELMPKLTRVAGFEWGSGFYINPTPPEDAAEYLRKISVESETS